MAKIIMYNDPIPNADEIRVTPPVEVQEEFDRWFAETSRALGDFIRENQARLNQGEKITFKDEASTVLWLAHYKLFTEILADKGYQGEAIHVEVFGRVKDTILVISINTSLMPSSMKAY